MTGVPWGADGGHGGEELGGWQEDSALQLELLQLGSGNRWELLLQTGQENNVERGTLRGHTDCSPCDVTELDYDATIESQQLRAGRGRSPTSPSPLIGRAGKGRGPQPGRG